MTAYRIILDIEAEITDINVAIHLKNNICCDIINKYPMITEVGVEILPNPPLTIK